MYYLAYMHKHFLGDGKNWFSDMHVNNQKDYYLLALLNAELMYEKISVKIEI